MRFCVNITTRTCTPDAQNAINAGKTRKEAKPERDAYVDQLEDMYNTFIAATYEDPEPGPFNYGPEPVWKMLCHEFKPEDITVEYEAKWKDPSQLSQVVSPRRFNMMLYAVMKSLNNVDKSGTSLLCLVARARACAYMNTGAWYQFMQTKTYKSYKKKHATIFKKIATQATATEEKKDNAMDDNYGDYDDYDYGGGRLEFEQLVAPPSDATWTYGAVPAIGPGAVGDGGVYDPASVVMVAMMVLLVAACCAIASAVVCLTGTLIGYWAGKTAMGKAVVGGQEERSLVECV